MKAYLIWQQSRRRILPSIIIFLCAMPFLSFQQQRVDIQEIVKAIKATHYCEDEDYHTDGQRTVWVKSYKKWMPDDMYVMKKEAPETLRFLSQAIKHNRLDVLEQLLPDYYNTHGGVKAFAADIQRIRQQ
jgi:hypothetical protein